MSVNWLWIFVGLGVLSIVVQLWGRWLDARGVDVDSLSEQLEEDGSEGDVTELLSKFGEIKAGIIPEEHLPLNGDFLKIATAYEQIVIEDTVHAFKRALMATPYEEHPEFVVIGYAWEEESLILVRRCSEEPTVYIAPYGDGERLTPRFFASSFARYLNKAQLLYKTVQKPLMEEWAQQNYKIKPYDFEKERCRAEVGERQRKQWIVVYVVATAFSGILFEMTTIWLKDYAWAGAVFVGGWVAVLVTAIVAQRYARSFVLNLALFSTTLLTGIGLVLVRSYLLQ